MLEVNRSVMNRPLRCASTSLGSPSRSSSEYEAPLIGNSSVSAIAPNAPMMASQGLTMIDGSGSGGRRPGRSSRVKQSCRLLKLVLRASERSRPACDRQVADQGVFNLAEPPHEPGQGRPRDAVGQQEVQIFLL